MALAFVTGAAATSLLIDNSLSSEKQRRLITFVRIAGYLILASGAMRMMQQALAFADDLATAPAMVVTLLGTLYGKAWLVQMCGALLIALWPGAVVPSQARSVSRSAGWALVLMVLIPPVFQGHAISSEELTAAAVLADAVHLLGAGVWIGSLAVLVLVVLPGLTASETRIVVQRFSPWALTGAGALFVTGVFTSWLQVRHLNFLWSTRYGQLLLLKVFVVLVVVFIGALNWRRLSQRLEETDGTARLFRSARGELLAAVVVFLVTAFLVATSLPGE